MAKASRNSMGVLSRMRIKGRDFDRDGVETPKEELFAMPGLFVLKDVEDRIPIDAKRLKYWYSSEGPYRKCFTKVPVGEVRSLVYVDLELLNSEFQANFERSQRR